MKPLRIWNLGLGGEGVKGLRGEGIKGLRIWNLELGIFKSGKRNAERWRAFTLIELLGVMAIIGILAAVILPSMISRIEDSRSANEDAVLNTIADALLKGIKAYCTFPNPNVVPDAANGWVTIAQQFFPRSAAELRYVFPKDDNFADTERRVYLDPALLQYLGNSFTMPATGFSTTDTDGDGLPDVEEAALRMYIVSSSNPKLILACRKNQPGQMMMPAPQEGPSYGASMITDLLNWVKAYQAPGSANSGSILVPSSIANWAAVDNLTSRRGEYLHVKIVPLEKLFFQVTLVDCASPSIISIATASNGNPYASLTWYSVSDGYGTTAQVRSNNPGGINPGNPQNLTRFLSDSDGYNNRPTTLYVANTEIYANPGPPPVPDPTDNAYAAFSLPGFPRYQLNSLAINTFTANAQTVSFYVLAGTRLRLYNSGGSLLRDENIISESNYKYWNGTWSRSD